MSPGPTLLSQGAPRKLEFYRLDKAEFGGSFKKMRGALLQLVTSTEIDAPHITNMRDKLIFNKAPVFELPERISRDTFQPAA